MKKYITFHNVIIFFLFPLIGSILIPYFQYELNPDGISYFSIAEKYQSGNFKDAVNGMWAPLLPWTLIPLLILNIPAIIAGKIAGIITGIILLLSLKNICKEFQVSGIIVSFLLIVSVCYILPYIFVSTNADLLMTAILLWYFSFIFSKKHKVKSSYGILCGLLGALAYLCKYFGFIFFIGHFTLITFIYYLSQKEARSIVVKNYISGLSMFLCLSALWIAALSFKYGEFTISTSGKYNFTMIGPTGGDHKILSGFYVPPNASAISAWEDPGNLHYDDWSPLSSYENFKYYMRKIYFNLYVLYICLKDFSPIIFIVLIISIYLTLKKIKLVDIFRSPISLLLITILFYSAGYILQHVEPRYLWPVYFLFLILLGILLQAGLSKIQLSNVRQYLILSILALFLIYSPLKYLSKNINIDKDTAVIASEIKNKYHIQGNIASDTGWSWFKSLFVCYHLKCTYFGAAAKAESKEQLLEDFKRYQIDYYFDWDAKDLISLKEYPELTNGSIPDLKIYKISR